MNMGGVAIILKTHILNVSSSNLGSFMVDFAKYFLNPLRNESKSHTAIDHDNDQRFSRFYRDTHSWPFAHVLQ
jgi:hypothetical protein